LRLILRFIIVKKLFWKYLISDFIRSNQGWKHRGKHHSTHKRVRQVSKQDSQHSFQNTVPSDQVLLSQDSPPTVVAQFVHQSGLFAQLFYATSGELHKPAASRAAHVPQQPTANMVPSLKVLVPQQPSSINQLVAQYSQLSTQEFGSIFEASRLYSSFLGLLKTSTGALAPLSPAH
jgi:hypothetical protein